MGAWFLCDTHEDDLLERLADDGCRNKDVKDHRGVLHGKD